MKVPLLPASGCIAALTESERIVLAGYGNFQDFEKGTLVIREGDPQDRLYFVVKGAFHATLGEAGNQILLGRISEGQWFGEINIFDPQVASATVTAKESSTLWSIPRHQLDRFMLDHTMASLKLVVGISELLSARVRGMIGKLEMVNLSNAMKGLYSPR
ncbi:MAG: cyclic nucleotide-binding domain-containing protein [Kiritimatiellia bacterium]|nr:cyclic nucleotide-binding domain-containing protein [Kiritimatiellia bacterium]